MTIIREKNGKYEINPSNVIAEKAKRMMENNKAIISIEGTDGWVYHRCEKAN